MFLQLAFFSLVSEMDDPPISGVYQENENGTCYFINAMDGLFKVLSSFFSCLISWIFRHKLANLLRLNFMFLTKSGMRTLMLEFDDFGKIVIVDNSIKYRFKIAKCYRKKTEY